MVIIESPEASANWGWLQLSIARAARIWVAVSNMN
jgi:hypothetical protein